MHSLSILTIILYYKLNINIEVFYTIYDDRIQILSAKVLYILISHSYSDYNQKLCNNSIIFQFEEKRITK